MESLQSHTSDHVPKNRGAFTLVELLVVIGVIAILLTILVPSFDQMGERARFVSQGDILENFLIAARQESIAKNHAVYVRFYKYSIDTEVSNNPHYRSCQMFRAELVAPAPGAAPSAVPIQTLKPIAPPEILDYPVVMSTLPGLSTLLTDPALLAGSDNTDAAQGLQFTIGDGSGYDFVGFIFYPDGSCSLPLRAGTDTWHLTLAEEFDEEQGDPLGDLQFITVQFDPRTGRTQILRP